MLNTLTILLLTATLCLATTEISRDNLHYSHRTLPVQGEQSDALVFDDDFESGDLSAWDVSQAIDYSLSDSPGSDYLPDTDSWAAFNSGNTINLGGTTSPELNFGGYGKYFESRHIPCGWIFFYYHPNLDNYMVVLDVDLGSTSSAKFTCYTCWNPNQS